MGFIAEDGLQREKVKTFDTTLRGDTGGGGRVIDLSAVTQVDATIVDGSADSPQANAGDLRAFSDAAGLIQLPMQIIEFVSSATVNDRRFYVVVGGTSDLVRLCWGTSTTASQPIATHAYGANSVYASNCLAHYSFMQSPSTTAPQLTDHTGNGHDMTSYLMTSGDLTDLGVVDHSWDFQGAAAYRAHDASLKPSSAYTWLLWIDIDDTSSTQYFISGSNYQDGGFGYNGLIQSGTAKAYHRDGSDTARSATIDASLSTGLAQFGGRWDDATDELDAIHNGSIADTTPSVSGMTLGTGYTSFGGQYTGSVASLPPNADISHAHIFDNALTAAQIENSYDNVVDGTTFWTATATQDVVTAAEAPGSATATPQNGGEVWVDIVEPSVRTGDGYEVERKPSGGSFTSVGTIADGQTRYTDTTATRETSYSYRVKQVDTGGTDSDWVESNEATTAPIDPVLASLSAVGHTSIQFDVSTSGGTSGMFFEFEKWDDVGQSWAVFASNAASASDTITANGLAPSTLYKFRARTQNGAGVYSAYSNELQGSTPAEPPTAVVAVPQHGGDVNVACTLPAVEADGIRFERCDPGETNCQLVENVATGVPSTVDDDAGPEVAYVYRAKSLDATHGDSAWAVASQVTTAPYDCSLSNSQSVRFHGFSVDNITPSTTGTSVEYETSPTGAETWTSGGSGALNATQEFDGLVIGQEYDVRARVSDGTLYSAWSNVVQATPIGSIAGFAVAKLTNNSVRISWTDNASETEYRIERSTDGETWAEIGTAAQDATSYDDEDLEIGTYYYRMRGYDSNDADFTEYTAASSVTIEQLQSQGYSYGLMRFIG